MDAFLNQFWPNIAGTLVGGIFLTLLFFIVKEYLCPLPQISGAWECEQLVEKTPHPPYMGMKVWYRVLLIQDGANLVGTGERDREDSSTGVRSYGGSDRTPIQVKGKIEKNYLSPDVIRIHWEADGEARKSSTFFNLKVSGNKFNGGLIGRVYTTAGPCQGRSIWTRLF